MKSEVGHSKKTFIDSSAARNISVIDLPNELVNFITQELGLQADELDKNPQALAKAFQRLAELGGLRLQLAKGFGGYEVTPQAYDEYRMLLARYSGALAFLQGQHQEAVWLLSLAAEQANANKALVGIGQGQGYAVALRQQSARQYLKVEQIKNGWQLNGTLPWVTGWGIYPKILCNFFTEDQAVYVRLPFVDTIFAGGQLGCSTPLTTAGLSAVNTVRIELTNWLVAEQDILIIRPKSQPWPRKKHNAVYYMAGCMAALLALIADGLTKAAINRPYQELYNAYQHYVKTAQDVSTDPLKVRAQGYQLAHQIAALALLAVGGRGMLANHPLQRLTRELWQYSLAGINDPLLTAYLVA
jgi:alkylation response protein AidB-like acyl-CoA dehydrogenase